MAEIPRGPEAAPGLDKAVDDLNTSIGPRRDMPTARLPGGREIPGAWSQEELAGGVTRNWNDLQYSDFGELQQTQVLRAEMKRVQMRKERDTATAAGQQFDNGEFIVSSQAAVYHRYIYEAVHQVSEAMTQYKTMRASVDRAVPADQLAKLDIKNKFAQTYVEQLDKAMRERVAFANVTLMATAIVKNKDGNGRVVQAGSDEYKRMVAVMTEGLKSPDLSPASKAVLSGGDPTALLAKIKTADETRQADVAANRLSLDPFDLQSNILNQRIIDVLAGKCGNGVPDGFFPQTMMMDLLVVEYTSILEAEKTAARDQTGSRAVARRREILAQTRDQVLPPDNPLIKEFKALEGAEQTHLTELAALSLRRKSKTSQLMGATEKYGKYQIQTAELVTVQEMYKEVPTDDRATIREPEIRNQRTHDILRKGIDKNMRIRGEFHVNRMGAFLDAVDKEVTSIGTWEHIEQFTTDNIRPFMQKAAHAFANIVTFPIPPIAGMRERAQRGITGDLDHAMGWPKGKENLPLDQLTPEEQTVVRERAQTVLIAIMKFKYKHRLTPTGVIEWQKKDGTFVSGNRVPTADLAPNEAMANLREDLTAVRGWPEGKTNYKDLSPDQKTAAANTLPPAATFVEGEVKGELPKTRINQTEMRAFIGRINAKLDKGEALTQAEKDEGITYHVRMFVQLVEDWGEVNPPSGFMGEYANYFGNIDKVLDTHILVGAGQINVGDQGFNYLQAIFYALVAIVGAKVVVKIHNFFRGTRAERGVKALTGKVNEMNGGLTELNERVALAEQKAKVAADVRALDARVAAEVLNERERTAATSSERGIEALDRIGAVDGTVPRPVTGGEARPEPPRDRTTMTDDRARRALNPIETFDSLRTAAECRAVIQAIDSISAAPRDMAGNVEKLKAEAKERVLQRASRIR